MAESEQKQDAPSKSSASRSESGSGHTREELLADARELTGASRHELVGALHGSDRKTYSKGQVEELLEKFRNRKAAAS